MSAEDHIAFREKVKTKVDRYDSKVNRFRRWVAGHPRFVQYKIQENIQEKAPIGSAKITVYVRRFDPDTATLGPIEYIVRDKPNLKPNVGLTFFLKQCYGSVASGTAMANTTTGCNFLAVGTSVTAPASGDTTLGTELAASGFTRMQAATTVSQPTATISGTFTATGTVSNIQEGGLLDAISSGNLGHHFTFTPTTCNNGDQLTIQVTITIS